MKWFKRLIRLFLKNILDEGKPDLNEIEVLIDGKIEILNATGVVGIGLVCVWRNGERMIFPHEARSKERFQELWAKLGGKCATWADGTPFEPFPATQHKN